MNNPPAFPTATLAQKTEGGMTLRDYFAAKAMQGLVTASHNDGGCLKCDDKYIAPLAYDIADDMMEARQA
jgi:aminoglycoside/choline kinase family phosphotransferase